jgi:hypothetical protein
MVAGATRRYPAGLLVTFTLGLCAVRHVLSPPGAAGECLVLAVVVLAVAGLARRHPVRGVPTFVLLAAGAFGGLVTLTALWQKGTGLPTALPPAALLGLSSLLTVAYAGAFVLLIPDAAERG